MRKFDHHLGDYASATGHLTIVEDGVYHRLLRHYYMTEEALPGDHMALCRIVRARSRAEKAAVDAVLCEFFYFDDESGTYRQDRCEREIVLMRARADDAGEKKANELSRMERHRQDRKHLAAGLRAKGHVIRWDLPMAELRDLAKLHGVALVAGEAALGSSAETHLQRTCNALATANHQPTTNHQPPTTNTHQPHLVAETEPARVVGRADEMPEPETAPPAPPVETAVLTEPAQPTPAARICKALRVAGIADVNPGHPDLLALIAAGCTEPEFTGAAAVVRQKGKGFGYLLGMLTKQRTEAAQKLAAMHKGEMPVQATPVPSHVVSADETQAYLREQEEHRRQINRQRLVAFQAGLTKSTPATGGVAGAGVAG